MRQVIEYSLRPLYDPAIPLESFMSISQAQTFRSALRSATEAAWAKAGVCSTNCTALYGANGYCVPQADIAGATVAYSCQGPGSLLTQQPAPLSSTAKQMELSPRQPLRESAMMSVPSMQILQVNDWPIVPCMLIRVIALHVTALPRSAG